MLVSNSCSLGFGVVVLGVEFGWILCDLYFFHFSPEVMKKLRRRKGETFWCLLQPAYCIIYLRSIQGKSPMGVNPYLGCWLIIGQNNITTAWMVEDFIRWKRKGNSDNCCKVINCAEHQVVQSVDQKVLQKRYERLAWKETVVLEQINK